MNKYIKKLLVIAVIGIMTMALFTACGKKEKDSKENSKTLKIGALYTPGNQDPHEGYNGWNIMSYGITETLFKVGDNMEIEPWLAESAEEDGCQWTIKLKNGIKFSNGDPVTADIVIENLKRTGEVNERFEQLKSLEYEAKDDSTVVITTPEPNPTFKNMLTSCETAIINLEKDPAKELIATGPFKIKKFDPEDKTEVEKNENYWNGDVNLDGAVIYKIADEDALLLAMQNGEIDTYVNVSGAAKETFEKEPEKYTLIDVSTGRLQMYILNEKTLNENVRKAIAHTIDPNKMMSQLGDIMTATEGPFNKDLAYGKEKRLEINADTAKKLLEDDGYSLNSDEIYEKDGKELTVNVAYYKGRSLDIMATLIQEQLKTIGIKGELKAFELPEDYTDTGKFDIALLSMNADIYGDPGFFIDSTIKEGGHYNAGGFKNAEAADLISKLDKEFNFDKRVDLANKIIQIAIDDAAYGYMTLTDKITVFAPGVKDFSEKSPYDFYGLNAKTQK